MNQEETRIELIEKYLLNKLTREEREAFEVSLENDPALQADTEKQKKLHSVIDDLNAIQLKERLKELDRDLESDSSGIKRQLYPRLAAAAAVLLLLVATAIFFLNKPSTEANFLASTSTEEIATSFYQKTLPEQFRGAESDSALSFEKRMEMADALFEDGQYLKAAEAYEALSKEDDLRAERAEWNMLLSRFAAGDDVYMITLDKIRRDTGHMFYKNASQLRAAIHQK